MCGQMRWVGPHEICDRRSPTKALHISAEFKRPLSTKYYNLLAFTGLGIAYCLTFGERLGMNLQDDTHVHYHHWGSQAMIESWVLCEWTHQLRAKTHEIKHETNTHYSANVTHCWWTWIWPQTTTMSSINYGCELLGCQVLIPILLFCFYQPLYVFKYFPNAFQVWFIFCIMWLKYK